jgi:hypothetical protein
MLRAVSRLGSNKEEKHGRETQGDFGDREEDQGV